jgi:hypothetical protein
MLVCVSVGIAFLCLRLRRAADVEAIENVYSDERLSRLTGERQRLRMHKATAGKSQSAPSQVHGEPVHWRTISFAYRVRVNTVHAACAVKFCIGPGTTSDDPLD